MARKNAKSDSSKPTDGELDILQVLWDRGPSTVREIHETLTEDKGTGYTTTLKLLQLMVEKDLVTRDESQRSHIYQAVEQETTQRQLVRDLLKRAFGGSPTALVVQALSETRASAEDLEEIQSVLDELTRKQKKPTKRPRKK